jgi:hypothetical protein
VYVPSLFTSRVAGRVAPVELTNVPCHVPAIIGRSASVNDLGVPTLRPAHPAMSAVTIAIATIP